MIQSFFPHYGLGIDSVCNRNEYQWYLQERGRGRLKVAGA
jgi:hypothetical protein